MRDLGMILGLAACSLGMHEARRVYERSLNESEGGVRGGVEELA